MQIVIDIPEDGYTWLKEHPNSIMWSSVYTDSILNGIPLPKGHGDLIDRNKIEYLKAIHDAKYGHISWSEATERIKYSAPTIIEADTESEEV